MKTKTPLLLYTALLTNPIYSRYNNDKIFRVKPEPQLLRIDHNRAVIKCALDSNYLDKFEKLQWAKDGFGLGYDDLLPGK